MRFNTLGAAVPTTGLALRRRQTLKWGLGALGMMALDATGATVCKDDFQRFDPQAWAVEAEAGDAGKAAQAERVSVKITQVKLRL